MEAIVGTFGTPADAIPAVERLRQAGIPTKCVNVFVPGVSRPSSLERLPVSDAEPSGTGEAIGGVVGAASGLTAGFQLGALATLLVPGVGAVAAIGLGAAALFGLGGAMAGKAVGGALEDAGTQGLPHDDLLRCQDALRRGATVVVVEPPDADAADKVRDELAHSGATPLEDVA
jgi:hypothetical protein